MDKITIKNLCFSYPGPLKAGGQILRGINFSISAGEMVAIQGPSGSGKSTLMYILGGLLGGYSGEVVIDGVRLSSLSSEALARWRNEKLGFVFQQFHLLPRATVIDNIILPSQYPVEVNQRARNIRSEAVGLATKLGIEELLEAFPNQLSGGQQQRVAIARALFNGTEIILADEPTGNLDTKSSMDIMALFEVLNQEGKTVLVVTHDPEVALQCDRVIKVRDGYITEDSKPALFEKGSNEERVEENFRLGTLSHWRCFFKLIPNALENLSRNRMRTLLTMTGIVVGIASVLSMITVGNFTQRKILESYAELGVHSLLIYGYPSWDQKARDVFPVVFQSFDMDKDIEPLKKIFPQIMMVSPMMNEWRGEVSFGGKTIDRDVSILGVSEHALNISRTKVIFGKNLSPYHIEKRVPNCLVGTEIFEQLFSNRSPLGQIIHVKMNESSFGCMVMGVLESRKSNKDWRKPNHEIYVPYTYFGAVADTWASKIFRFLLELDPRSDVERTGDAIKAYFEKRYGKSGEFIVSSDSRVLSQMKKFLTLFTWLLGIIAMVSLCVGGMGIANMMLVSVTERFREIGVRKAFGATDYSIRVQYLLESLFICLIAGLVGLVVGFAFYELAISVATGFIKDLSFEWVFEGSAVVISLCSILAVGVLSGIVPALKAERLEVIEALRSE